MMTMNLNKLSVWAVGACLCAASISHAAAAGIDSYDAALKKVKEVKAALDPLKSKNFSLVFDFKGARAAFTSFTFF